MMSARACGSKVARSHLGFTMIELVVVMALIGLLLSLAVPRYMDSLERGKEKVMEHDLAQMRRAIDQYYSDRGAYPDELQDLVDRRYLRAIPLNPFTETVDWLVVPPTGNVRGRVFDVRDPANPDGTTPRNAERTKPPAQEAVDDEQAAETAPKPAGTTQ
jgi:general secretion pathway protein G